MSPRLRAVALGTLLMLVSGHSWAQNPTLETAMRSKRLSAQLLLEAIVAVDYARIDRSAAALDRISETEIGTWQSRPRPEYLNQAMAFLTSVQDLRDAAGKRDREAVLAANAALVASCTRCHDHVQRARIVSFEP